MSDEIEALAAQFKHLTKQELQEYREIFNLVDKVRASAAWWQGNVRCGADAMLPVRVRLRRLTRAHNLAGWRRQHFCRRAGGLDGNVGHPCQEGEPQSLNGCALAECGAVLLSPGPTEPLTASPSPPLLLVPTAGRG